MKKQSSSLKIIVLIINILCFLQGLLTAVSLVLIPFLPPYFKFNFSLKTDGLLSNLNGDGFPFAIPEVVGFAFFEEGFKPNYLVNVYWFMMSLVVLFILFQFKDFVNSVAENKAFEPKNYLRFRHMGIAFFSIIIIEALYFLFVEIPMAKLIQHESIAINTSYNFSLNFNWQALFLGLTFLILAAAFKEGFALKQETDLTI